MKMKMKMKPSGSTKEPSRTSPFVRGPPVKTTISLLGPSPFIGGARGDRHWTP